MRRLTQPSRRTFSLQMEGCGPAVGQPPDSMIGRAHRDYGDSIAFGCAAPPQILVPIFKRRESRWPVNP
jgi:hypothetical protein